MQNKAYRYLTDICVFVAVGSAIAFNIFNEYQLLIGFIAIIAGTISLGSYLYRHQYFNRPIRR